MSDTSEAEVGPESGLTLRVLKETAPGERRVALVPGAVARLRAIGIDVVVESGAGSKAWFSDDAYVAARASIAESQAGPLSGDIVVTVDTMTAERVRRLVGGQTLIGLLRPLTSPDLVRALAEREVTAISLDGLPRTLSRAQNMDVLTSQANLAGYKAALVAANAFDRLFPMMITAAGTARPAEVLVLGAGVAGLQAMGTARRLGAVVSGYDVRPETRHEIESVGARFLELSSVGAAAGEGGYARALTEGEAAAEQEGLAERIARFDVVITTAQVPGRPPPILVSEHAVKQMRPGSVLVDLAAGVFGGNVEGAPATGTTVTGDGVTIIAAGNLASEVAGAASSAFSNNLTALLEYLVHDGILVIDPTDEIQAGVLITHHGRVVHPGVAASLESCGGRP